MKIGKGLKKAGSIMLLLTIMALMVASIFANYSTESTVTAKVISINTRLEVGVMESNTNASTTYLVSTDKGVFKIEPDGLMASTAFGTLEAGKTYIFHVRGIRMELLKHLPYIIDAELVE